MSNTKKTSQTAQQAVDMFCKASEIDMSAEVRNVLAYMLDEFWLAGYECGNDQQFSRLPGIKKITFNNDGTVDCQMERRK